MNSKAILYYVHKIRLIQLSVQTALVINGVQFITIVQVLFYSYIQCNETVLFLRDLFLSQSGNNMMIEPKFIPNHNVLN